MTGAGAVMTGAATGALADAEAEAEAAAAAATRLRILCLSAAAGIRHECDRALEPPPGASASTFRNGEARGAGGKYPCAGAGDGCDDSLAGCGEPLVQLLSRQAAGLLALYDYEGSSSSASPHPPAAPVPSPVGSGQCAAGKKQNPGDAAVRPYCCQGGQDGTGMGTGTGNGGRGSGGDADADGGCVGLLILRRLDDLLSVAYSRFYAYLYKDLPLCWRQLYTDASILKFSYLFLSSPYLQPQPPSPQLEGNGRSGLDMSLPDTQLDDMVKTLDLALILAGAGGHTRGRRWIDTAFLLLEDVWRSANGAHHGGSPPTTITTTTTTPPPAKKPRLEHPSPANTETWQSTPSFSTYEPFTPPVRHPIHRVPADAVDMAEFQRHLDGADPHRGPEPLVLTGLADGWPARTERPWDRPSYLLSRTFGGRRLVPVEVGRSYVDEGWGQQIVTFGEFLRGYIDPSAGTGTASTTSTKPAPDGDPPPVHDKQQQQHEKPVAYLAQHQLFLQLPHLRRDILVPDQCYTAPPRHPTDPSQDRPELEAGPLLNAWLGPPGTITPLHTDPYHNVLAQVVGRKYVRLYSPLRAGGMRARGREAGVEMGNTSLLDVGVVEGWDVDPGLGEDEDNGDGQRQRRRDAVEEFRSVPYVDCILEPGDGLYIPIGWWHYVRGLSVSFSVSLWWN